MLMLCYARLHSLKTPSQLVRWSAYCLTKPLCRRPLWMVSYVIVRFVCSHSQLWSRVQHMVGQFIHICLCHQAVTFGTNVRVVLMAGNVTMGLRAIYCRFVINMSLCEAQDQIWVTIKYELQRGDDIIITRHTFLMSISHIMLYLYTVDSFVIL